MRTITNIKYKIVIIFRSDKKILKEINKNKLYMYLSGILLINRSQIYSIQISENQLQIVTHIHPDISISGLIKELKKGFSKYLNSYSLFPHFVGSQVGDGTFTYKLDNKLANKKLSKFGRSDKK